MLTIHDKLLAEGKQVAFVVRKGALEFQGAVTYANEYTMLREDIIRKITEEAGEKNLDY